MRIDVKFDEAQPNFKVDFAEANSTFDVSFGEMQPMGDIIEPAHGNTVRIGDIIYKTLGAALKAVQSGETIKLLNNITYNDFINYTTDFCIDLNGYTLKAKGLAVLASGGGLVDNGETKGLLEVPRGFLVMSHAANSSMLPIWNEEGTGYIFATVREQYKFMPDLSTQTSFVIDYRLSVSGGGVNTREIFADGALDNGLSFKSNALSYNADGTVRQILVLSTSDETVATIYTNRTSIRLRLNGAGSSSAEYGIVTVLESETGFVYQKELGRFNTGVFTPIVPMS